MTVARVALDLYKPGSEIIATHFGNAMQAGLRHCRSKMRQSTSGAKLHPAPTARLGSYRRPLEGSPEDGAAKGQMP